MNLRDMGLAEGKLRLKTEEEMKDFYVDEIVYLESIIFNGLETDIDDDVEVIVVQEDTCTIKGTAYRGMDSEEADEFEYTFVVPKKDLIKYDTVEI